MPLFEVSHVSMPTDEETYLLLDAVEVDRKVYTSSSSINFGYTEAQADDADNIFTVSYFPFVLPAGKQLWGHTTTASNTFRYVTTVAR